MGKSGHIANKIAATLASTGTPAFFVHPGEAQHGDMGMITPDDVALAISNSGTTPEILSLVPVMGVEGVWNGLVTLFRSTGPRRICAGRVFGEIGLGIAGSTTCSGLQNS